MNQACDRFGPDDCVALVPWAWIQLDAPPNLGPFPFLCGVEPEVIASLHEAHHLLLGLLEHAVYAALSADASLKDPSLRRQLEDAYAEVVQSRPNLQANIRCGRRADGTFQWEYALDPAHSPTIAFTRLRLWNALTQASVPLELVPSSVPAVGRFLGLLDGTHRMRELQSAATELDAGAAPVLTRLLDALHSQKCLALSAGSALSAHWSAATRDRDLLHLGHATLLYREHDHFFLFDPWLMPWLAESPVPSPWGTLLPRPSAIFLTHEHSDHLDIRTLLHLPKDIAVIVPSRKNRRALAFDYVGLLGALGFDRVVELAHGDSWTLGSAEVVAVPFFGEDPCELSVPRNCYLLHDRDRNALVLADSGPTNSGSSVVTAGIITELVRRYGPITTILATRQQVRGLCAYHPNACLSPPGKWLEVGEDSYLTVGYLADLAAGAKARLLVCYAMGGADWYPDYQPTLFTRRNSARTALLTADWEPVEKLVAALAPHGCRYHASQAFDLFRPTDDGGTQVLSVAEALHPLRLFGWDQTEPSP